MNKLFYQCRAGLFACLLVGCASTNAPTPTPAASPSPSVSATEPADVEFIEPAQAQTPREAFVEEGSGTFLNPSPANAPDADGSETDVDIDFDGSPLADFIALVLGDLLGVNYVIDPAVTGTITLHTSTSISRSELLPLVNQVLEMNGARLLESNGFYQVLPAAAVRPGTISPTIANGSIPGQAIQIFTLQYISATEMQKLLTPVVADPGAISIDETRNLVIASGSAGELTAIRDTIEIFDVDWLQGMSLGLFPLEHVDPETLEEELSSVLNTSAETSSLLMNGLVRLVPFDRLKSLLVVSSTASALRQVEVWIRRLDQPSYGSGKKLFVYKVQNAKAVELAEILGRILEASSETPSEGAASSAAPVLAPGLTPTEISSADAAAEAGGNSSASTNLVGLGSAILGDVQIIADDVRNTLVILADDTNYQTLAAAIEELDVVPLQVLIEASIIEVSLRDDLSYGVEWFFRNRLNSDEFRGQGMLDLGDSGISALAPGFSYTVMDSADQVRVALNTLASESEVNVLSAPSLMVLDNQTAMINVGDEIPVPTRQSISNIDPISPTVNEITFRQTGITLTVTPRVNNSGLVTMEISQEVSSAATTTTSNLDAPTIQNREINSVVAIASGETIILGGLMLEQQSTSESGLPLLHSIPILGNLFSQNNNGNSRTELLVLITPKVVRSPVDARAITEEYRTKLLLLPPLSSSDASLP